ncbi:hypothetical protein AMTRI_Chr04g182380 [Amborella trichopoda]
MGSQVAGKPHALCVPFPAQGHINPMMQLARLLHSKGFYIKFVNSEFNQDRITEANGHVPATGFDDFRLESIPDGLPPSYGRTTNVLELCDFWTTSACGYWAYLQIPVLMERGYTPLKDSSCLADRLETILDWTTDPDDFLFNYNHTVAQMALRTSTLILNTFYDLEKDVIEAMRSRIACPLYTIGPLLTFCEHESKGEDKSISTSLWKLENECLAWLDQQQPNGWNSMLEAICNGVPIMSWPYVGEQQTNCRYACIEWGFGMETGNNVKRDEVEAEVKELIEGTNGKEMRTKIMKWKQIAENAIKPGGPSYKNLDTLVKEVLLKNYKND